MFVFPFGVHATINVLENVDDFRASKILYVLPGSSSEVKRVVAER